MIGDRGYQHGYAGINPDMYDAVGRSRKAQTMLAVLGEQLGAKLAQARVLNLGCSTGLIDENIAPRVESVLGVDIDSRAIFSARDRSAAARCRFMVGDALALGLADAMFDVVICSQVYEHVPDPARMMAEIHRVLVPGGLCYFAATSRWSVVEMHYKLPFLSWLPPRWANRYLRLLGRGSVYYERHLGVGDLRRLVAAFELTDATPNIVANPARYAAEYLFPSRAARLAARLVLRWAYPMFPGVVWLLRKPTHAG